MSTQHRLSNVDKEAMTADCKVCGVGIPLEFDGKRTLCKKSRQEIRRRYKNRNRKSSRPSPHALKGGTSCPVCGPVIPVAWGRGYMCPTRATELGWKPQVLPDPTCRKCGRFLTSEGVCLTCTPVYLPDDLNDGFHIGEIGLSGRNESAVPGWKVIGPPLEEGSPWAAYLADPDFDLDNAV